MFIKVYLRLKRIFDRRGVGTVEILIILAVLVALALIFREFILDIADTIFSKIRENANQAIEGL